MNQPVNLQALLVSNWKLVITRSWSIWLILLAGALSGLEASLSSLPQVMELDQGNYALASVAVSAAAWFARLLAQKALHPDGNGGDGDMGEDVE